MISTVIPPKLKVETNTTNDWKNYIGRIYSLSYPPGWKVEECLQNCADFSTMRATKNKGKSYLHLTNQTYDKLPVNQCSTEVNKRTYFWTSENQEYLHTKDNRTFEIVEGDYIGTSSTDPKTSTNCSEILLVETPATRFLEETV